VLSSRNYARFVAFRHKTRFSRRILPRRLHLGIRFRAIESRQGGVGRDLSRFEFERRDVGNGSAILWRTLEETIDRENVLTRSDPINSRLSFSLFLRFCLSFLLFSLSLIAVFLSHAICFSLYLCFFFRVNAVTQSPTELHFPLRHRTRSPSNLSNEASERII